jgi:hypothetical protein
VGTAHPATPDEPPLEYCSIVWSPIYRRGVDALESLQRKFAKYLLFKLIAEFPPRGTPNSVLYNMTNLRSLNMRRNDSFLIFLYKIIHDIINSPFLLSQIYFNVPRANLRSGHFFMFREQLLIYCIVPLFILPAHYSIATVVSAIFL